MKSVILVMKNTHLSRKTPWVLKLIIFLEIFFGVVFFISENPVQLEASPSRNIHIESQPPFFSPNQLTISAGTPLTWRNRSHEPHTIVSDDCRSRNACSFDSGFLGPNARFTLPRLKPGRYPYHCGIHPFMRGLLTIHPPQSFSSSDI